MTARGKRAELNLLEDYCDLTEEEIASSFIKAKRRNNMYQIIDKRGTGKTLRLMLLAKETGAIIVCANPQAFEAKAKAYGIEGLTFISYEDMYNVNYNPNKKLLINEIEAFLKTWNNNIIGFNMSIED